MGKRRSRGEGSIFYYEKKGLWVAEITLDGKTRRKYEKTQKEARAWLLEMRKQAAGGVVVDDRRMTLGQFMDRYYQDIALHSLRPKTLESYESLIRVHIKPGLGSIRLSSLTPAHIQKFYSDKLTSGLSKRTVQYIHSILHKALDYAVRWGLTARNVSDLVDKPSPKRKPVEPLTVEQVNRLLDAVEGTRYFPIIVCACYLGLREGEVLGIHVEDLDLANGILHVRHAVQQLKGQGLVITEPKSDASKQPLKIPEFTIAVLKTHVGQLKENQGLIFTTKNGTPIGPRNLVRQFKHILKTAGLPDIRFHDLRHTTASLLIQAGAHGKQIQQAMRHSQWNLTMDTYGHLMPGMENDTADRINTLLGRT